MWRKLLKNFIKRKASGNKTSESAKSAVKDTAKEKVKDVMKENLKANILRILGFIMFPWGIIFLIVIFVVTSVAVFFTEDNKVFTSQEIQYIQNYASQHQNEGLPSNVESVGDYEPTAQIIENYIKFLVMEKKISVPVSYNEVVSLTKEAFKDLKPQFELEDATKTIVTTTTTKDSKDKNGLVVHNTKTTTQKFNIKIVKEVNSVYGKYTLQYQNETTTNITNLPNETVVTQTTVPQVVSNKRIDNFSLLTSLLKKQGLMYNDMEVAIGAILFSNNSINSWDWLIKNKLPNPQLVNVNSGMTDYNGSLAGIPAQYKSYEPYFIGAANATGVPPWLLVADVGPESGWNYKEVSSTGAVGLLQFEPYNFDDDCTQYGMLSFLHQNGFQGSIEQLKQELYTNPKLQIYVGAWEWRFYFDYTIHEMGLTPTWGFETSKYMSKIPWNAKEGSKDYQNLEWIIKETALIYNKGQGSYGENPMNYAYSCQVFNGAMQIRNSSHLTQSNIPQNVPEVVKKAIEAGEACIGNSQYIFGAGRTMAQQKAHEFDCSSFVWYCYNQAGLQLGPLSSVTTYSLIDNGIVQKVPVSQRQVGDLIFFSLSSPLDHVGIYIGNNEFINDEVHGAVRIQPLNSYWGSHVDTYARPTALLNN